MMPGETLALVGESGCGKTTLGRALVGLYPTTHGAIRFKGEDLATMTKVQRQQTRHAIQMIFQDPYESLNPRLPVSDVITEPLLIHGIGSHTERADRARALIAQVGLPVDALNRYPHQFSGGQRQRIAIARALGPEPELIVADEPLSALDVSIQSQILNLMSELREQRRLSYLFISHDLSAVHHLADRVAVMYLGRLVEVAPRSELFAHAGSPLHPGAPGCHPPHRAGAAQPGPNHSGRPAEPAEAAVGLCLSPALPEGAGPVQDRGAGAAARARAPAAAGGVPLQGLSED